MKQTKITLYVGLNDKDQKIQLIDTLEACKIVTNIITSITEGGTIYNATGIYKHDNGTIITENTLKIELYNCTDKAVYKIIETVKTILNQESIIKETTFTDTEFC